MIDEKRLWDSPNETIPSIGNMILHICGNARQWILSGIGGKEDNRDRDQEFLKQENIKKSELVFLLENIKVNLRQTLRDMDPSILEKEMILQGFKVTGFSAIVHVIEHFSYHTGQITTLTKYYTNKPTAFYGDINLNVQNRLN
jgi:uncharacterized damage-inducible protein DinB